jgi:hypothetical protein
MKSTDGRIQIVISNRRRGAPGSSLPLSILHKVEIAFLVFLSLAICIGILSVLLVIGSTLDIIACILIVPVVAGSILRAQL